MAMPYIVLIFVMNLAGPIGFGVAMRFHWRLQHRKSVHPVPNSNCCDNDKPYMIEESTGCVCIKYINRLISCDYDPSIV